MKRAAGWAVVLVLVCLAVGAVMVGCSGGPKRWERGWLEARTNVVEVVGYESVTNAAGAVELARVTNYVETYEFQPGTNAVIARGVAEVGGGVLGGWGELAGLVVGFGFGLWAQVRNKRANLTAEALAQIIETGRQALKVNKETAALEETWTSWMHAHQREKGVVEDVIRILGRLDAKEAWEVGRELSERMGWGGTPVVAGSEGKGK